MKKSRFTEQQIVYAIKQAEAGVPIAELCRKYGISQQTFYRWRRKHGGLAPQAQVGDQGAGQSGVNRRRRHIRSILLVLWALSLVQLLTLTSITRFGLLSPFLSGPNLIASAFVITSISLVHQRARWMLPIHLVVVLIVVVSHPMTTYFGRDGSLAVLVAYFLAVVSALTAIRPQYKLLIASCTISVLILESLLSLIATSPAERFDDLLDYDDLVGEYREGGFLVPNLDTMVIGDTGPVRFVTNRFGFRDRSEVEFGKPPGTFRIMFIGDSFVSGFRTDQDHTIGQVLEDELRRATGDPGIEVLIVGAAHPGAYLEYLRTHAFGFAPDLILVGLTIGNDISHSYGARTGTLTELDMFTSAFLPRDAFTDSLEARLAVRLDRGLQHWRIYRTLSDRFLSRGVGAWSRDVPFDVHLFGPNHSIGHFYALRPLEVVEASYDDLFFYLREIHALGATQGVGIVTVLLPQRFQVSERDWRGQVFKFALEETAFDLESPNRRILEFCGSAEVACLDLLPAFRMASDEELYLPLGDMHWNARGHQLAGRSVADYLLETSRVPRPPE